jgi:hypothetical protein
MQQLNLLTPAIDGHSQDVAGCMLLLFMLVKAANNCYMDVGNPSEHKLRKKGC